MGKKRVFSGILLAVLAGIGVFYYIQHKGDIRLISHVSLGAILTLSALIIILSILNGLQLKVLTDYYKLGLNFRQWFGISRANSLINLWFPIGGGTSLKAFYLRKIHNLKFSSFIASTGIAQVIVCMVNSLLAGVMLIFFGETFSTLLFAIISSVFIGTFIFLVFGHKLNSLHSYSPGYLRSVIEEWRRIRVDHKTIGKLIFLSSFGFIINTFRVFVSFHVFSLDISIATSGIIAALTMISGILNIIPGNLGIREAIVISVAGMSDIGINEGLHVAALDRVVLTVLTLILTAFFARDLLQKNE